MGYGSSHTPCDAGAFVFGRTRTSKTAEGRTHIAALPREERQVVRDAHVGYVTWEAYEAHVAQLAANRQAYTPHRLHPPREGPALLQGLVLWPLRGADDGARSSARGQRIVPDSLSARPLPAGNHPVSACPGAISIGPSPTSSWRW